MKKPSGAQGWPLPHHTLPPMAGFHFFNTLEESHQSQNQCLPAGAAASPWKCGLCQVLAAGTALPSRLHRCSHVNPRV